MSWESEIEEIKRRVEMAKQMGGAANVERQHASGKLTVRERIEQLVDPGSFHEIGALAGKATYEEGRMVSFVPSNYVMGPGASTGAEWSSEGMISPCEAARLTQRSATKRATQKSLRAR